jgi:hypothetical protein
MLSEDQVGTLVRNELDSALSYEGEIAKKRAKMMDYYNAQPYGDEVDGQSSAVTTDVSDVIEWMLPSLLRIFTQGKNIAQFEASLPIHDDEADQKTALANHVFMKDNRGVLILHDMFKDALLQFTGVVKVYWDDSEDSTTTKYCGMSEMEYQKLLSTTNVRVEDVEIVESELGPVYNANVVKVEKASGVKCVNIPPEEFLISKSARNFDNPVFIGHRSPKTRSDLIEMGFDKDKVNSLPTDDYYEKSEQKNARYHDYDNWQDANPSHHSPNDIVYLGEYYYRCDVNEDGITELWQVWYGGDTVLEMVQVDEHPFAVCVPIPIPHRAIGTCPAEQVSDLQFRKSTLVRQMLNNVYQSNYPRIMHSNKVDLDDLLTPRAGGLVGIDSDAPDVGGHAQFLQITPMIEPILRSIEYTDMEREIRTGITRYSQGLDAESLNKTATGFLGIKDASQQRLDLIARIFAEGGVKDIFKKIITLLGKYQNDAKAIRVSGEPLDINPKEWADNTNCRIDVGLGSGDRQEKIMNLNAILQRQLEFKDRGLVLSDQTKMYNTLGKLITEVGLKDADLYFNDPSVPEDTLFAENQQLAEMVRQLQAQVQNNPLAEAEMVKAQAKLTEAEGKDRRESRQFIMKMAQEDGEFRANLAKELTELELKYGQDVPGSTV